MIGDKNKSNNAMFLDNQTCPEFTVQVLDEEFIQQQPERRQEIINLVTESFCQGEPVTKFLGIQPEKYSTYFVSPLVDKAIKDKLSLVCVDANSESKCIVGAMLNEDFYDTIRPIDEARIKYFGDNLPEILPVVEFVHHLEKKLVETKFS